MTNNASDANKPKPTWVEDMMLSLAWGVLLHEFRLEDTYKPTSSYLASVLF